MQLRRRGGTAQRFLQGKGTWFLHAQGLVYHLSICAAIPTTAWDRAAVLPKRMQAESQDPQNSCLILFLTPKSSATYAVPRHLQFSMSMCPDTAHLPQD